MSVKRHGYTLMEMLAVMAALVIMMAVSVKPFRMMASDIPRANRDFQVWIQSQDMFRHLKQDVELAVSMRLEQSPSESSQKRLVLQQSQHRVVYTLTDETVQRQTETSETQWRLPHVTIKWTLWNDDMSAYALESATWIERTEGTIKRKKYNQRFVYFRNITE